MPEFSRIFGIALLAAYTVAPRQSSPRCLPVSYLEIYGCLTAPADAASLCSCKQVCIALASAYIRHRFACRIYCSASAEQSPLPARILFGNIRLPYGTRRCRKPLQLQTSLHRAGFSHLSLRFLYLQMGRQIFLLCSRLLRIFA